MGFDRLHPSIQHHVVNSLGWRDLRSLQQQSIDPILDGEHCLLLAPTAGGKTEAAVLPVLSRILSDEWVGLSVLYICPIRALLNNLEERLSYYCSLVGRRCGLWHGDVGHAARSAILRDPPDILLTTPESLEAILISRRSDRKYFFGNLRAVVIDEIHSFAADDRGWHLLAVLERIAVLSGHQPQRIGLSATIGNPKEILSWMTRGDEPSRVVSPPAAGLADADVTLDYVGNIDNAALVIAQLHRGEKRLVFSDSRSQAEHLASLLRAGGTNTFVSHSSLSADERRQAERAFRDSRDCVIVATSTLELGIDVGDLDHVLQLEAPTTVASFLQRLGRTGRRPGNRRNCVFLCTHRGALVASAALIRLWRSGYVEPLHSPADPYPVAAQQIMALIRQEGGASIRFDDSTIRRAFSQDAQISEDLISHMLDQRILFQDSGILGIGPYGERLYGAKNFMPLMSVFDTPPLFQVVCGVEELGWVHPLSFVGLGKKSVVISLGGRAWEVIRLDEERSIAHVRAIEAPGRSMWLGGSRSLSSVFCSTIRSLLLDESVDPFWSSRAHAEIHAARSEAFAVRTSGRVVETDAQSGRTRWWTFGGLKANYCLALMLRTEDGIVPRFDNFFVEVPGAGGLRGMEELVQKITGTAGYLPLEYIAPPGRIKFWDCLPMHLRRQYSASRFTDSLAAFEVINEPRVHIDSPDPEANQDTGISARV
ncbi:MAG TPA: DEAD/DEAH box helicase [Terriglobales bacterium]|nr:DEAD/DEAH box helicase [Terriglobales bacterium]